jgi:hypothetical protein
MDVSANGFTTDEYGIPGIILLEEQDQHSCMTHIVT